MIVQHPQPLLFLPDLPLFHLLFRSLIDHFLQQGKNCTTVAKDAPENIFKGEGYEEADQSSLRET
jgi:hypothetical protein